MTAPDSASVNRKDQQLQNEATARGRTKVMLQRLRFALLWLLRAIRFAPVSSTMFVVQWVLHFAFGHSAKRQWAALGISPHHFIDWHIFTAGLTTGTKFGAGFATVAMLLLAVPAESVLGSKRFTITAIGMYIVTTPLTLLAAASLKYTVLNYWGQELRLNTFLTPSGWIVGTIAVATAFMPVLWRRRTRTILLALFVTMLLFTGTMSDIAAVFALLIGIPVGNYWRNRRIGPPVKHTASVRESRILVAIALFFVALGPVLAAINPGSQGIFADITDWIWQPAVSAEQINYYCGNDAFSAQCFSAEQSARQSGVGPMVANLMPLLLTGIICLGLARGRRLAWWLSIAVQIASITVILAQVNFYASGMPRAMVLTFVLAQLILPWLLALVLLVATRRLFYVNIDRKQVRISVLIVLGAFVVTALFWFFGALSFDDSFHPNSTAELALLELPNRFLPPVVGLAATHHLLPMTSFAWFIYEWAGNIFWLVVAVMLYRLLMSVSSPTTFADRLRLREMLKSGSGDHLSWMALWRDNRYWFDPEERGAVAFRVHNGVAVTVGEPIVAPTGSRSELANEFENYAHGQGWQTAWYSVREDFAADRAPRGYMNVHVAEESVLLCDDETIAFKGKKFQNIRTARNRAKKEDIEALWTTWAQLPINLQEGIVQLSEEWMSEKSLPEMGFTLGGVTEMQDLDTKLLLAVDSQDRIHGVTSWIPVYEKGRIAGYTLDVMRRDSSGFRPVIEFLLAEAAVKGNELGIDFVSLSGAPLAPSQSKQLDGLLDVTLDKVGETMEPLYGFRSLAASKYKFHPAHHGWYLVYDDELALPSIGMAVSQCYLPQLKARDALNAIRIWSEAQRDPATD